MELREYLKNNNISITDFACKLDYARTHMSYIVNGHRKPSSKMKRQIIKITKGAVDFED